MYGIDFTCYSPTLIRKAQIISSSGDVQATRKFFRRKFFCYLLTSLSMEFFLHILTINDSQKSYNPQDIHSPLKPSAQKTHSLAHTPIHPPTASDSVLRLPIYPYSPTYHLPKQYAIRFRHFLKLTLMLKLTLQLNLNLKPKPNLKQKPKLKPN